MDTPTRNRLAKALGIVAALASLASLAPLPGSAGAILAVAGFAALAGALHTVKPPETMETSEQRTLPHVLAAAAGGFAAIVGLLLVAALAARLGNVRYLGVEAVFLSQNFAVVTGPFVALLGGTVALAATGRLARTRPVDDSRRALSVTALSLVAIVAAVFAAGLVGETWQAPYVLGLGAVIAWIDATHAAGLPTMRDVGRWLERGETRVSRWLMQQLSRSGNALVAVAALVGTGLLFAGYPTPGLLALAGAAAFLTLTTHAAAGLMKALPRELSEEIDDYESQQSRLRLLGIGPAVLALLAGVATAVAGVSMATGDGFTGPLVAATPVVGVAVAILAGLNLARRNLPSFDKAGTLRRATATTTAGIVATSLFFALLVELGIMAGPVTDAGLGVLFTYAALFGLSLFVLARGQYPVPGTDVEEAPEEVEELPSEAAKTERSLMAVYVLSGLFVVAATGALAMLMLGQWDPGFPASGESRNAAFLAAIGVGVVLLIGLAAVYFRSRQLETPHEDTVDFERDYTSEEVLRMTVLGVSGTLAFVLGLLGVLVQMGQVESIAGYALEPRFSTDFFVFAVLIGIGPAGYLHNRERKRVKAIDERLPEFLRDLAESQRTGMTLTQAVITASKGNYGALTGEIEKMAAQIEWGVSFDRALRSFAERVDTPLVQRTVSLVIEASNSGGDVMDVLEAAAEDAREIQQIKHERKSGMQIYVMIIYIAFFVFIGVIGVLNVKFMPEVARAVSGAEGVSVGSIEFQEFEMQTFRTLFFHAAVIQGLGGGFVAGSMEEGHPTAGLKHAFAMTMMAYLAFRLLLGG